MRVLPVGSIGMAFALGLMAAGCGGKIYLPAPKDDAGQADDGGAGSGDTVTVGGDADLGDSGTDPGDVGNDPGDNDPGDAGNDPGDMGPGDSGPGDADEYGCAGGNVAVCHVPPEDPGNAHVICVDETAVDALLEHGDYLGACADPGDTDPGDAGTDPGDTGPGGVDPDNTDSGADPAWICGEHDDKLLVCHASEGHGCGPHTICIAQPAFGAHLDHGDLPGPCEQ